MCLRVATIPKLLRRICSKHKFFQKLNQSKLTMQEKHRAVSENERFSQIKAILKQKAPNNTKTAQTQTTLRHIVEKFVVNESMLKVRLVI